MKAEALPTCPGPAFPDGIVVQKPRARLSSAVVAEKFVGKGEVDPER